MADNLPQDRMGTIPMGAPMDPRDHIADSGHDAAMGMSPGSADTPATRPFKGTQKSNIPEPNPHTTDPWNKMFKPGGT